MIIDSKLRPGTGCQQAGSSDTAGWRRHPPFDPCHTRLNTPRHTCLQLEALCTFNNSDDFNNSYSS